MAIYLKLICALLSIVFIPQIVFGEALEQSIKGLNTSKIQINSPSKRELSSQHESIASLGPLDPEKIMKYLYHVLNKRSANNFKTGSSPVASARQRRMVSDDDDGSEESRKLRFRKNRERMEKMLAQRRSKSPQLRSGSPQESLDSMYETLRNDGGASSSQDTYATVNKFKKMQDRARLLHPSPVDDFSSSRAIYATVDKVKKAQDRPRRMHGLPPVDDFSSSQDQGPIYGNIPSRGDFSSSQEDEGSFYANLPPGGGVPPSRRGSFGIHREPSYETLPRAEDSSDGEDDGWILKETVRKIMAEIREKARLKEMQEQQQQGSPKPARKNILRRLFRKHWY
uniref:Uncharacterized protein n=1 Tax=Meteorus pulchricornis TaxID=51522 RepID=H7CHL0_9HYME|nr:hypothetical protein [Meteorus pulchricornis]